MTGISTSEAQVFLDALENPVVKKVLLEFFGIQKELYLTDLMQAVRRESRDYNREAQIAGRVDAYETAYAYLLSFLKGPQ